MKIFPSATVLIVLFIYLQGFSQHKVLTGIVKIAGQPVSRLSVYTQFANTITDDHGIYALSLDGCAACRPGEKISIYTHHEDYGSTEQVCTISNDYQFNFSISRNPASIFITGIVKSAGQDGEGLANIDVKVIGEYDMDPVKTNSFGEFRIPILKDQIEGRNAVRMQAADPERKYRPLHGDPELFNLNGFVTILMESKVVHWVGVSGYTKSTVCVKKDDVVTMDAGGSIRIGEFAGTSDPDGRAAGVLGLSLEQYSIVREFNHAVLMYRLEGDTEWKVAGKKKRFVASRNGCIEFEVNDNKQDDNSGAYNVEISIQ